MGNLGMNTLKFCKEFNDFTSDLPSYFLLKVIITVFEDSTFSFSVDLPPTGFFISMLSFKKSMKESGSDIFLNCMKFRDLVQIALLKFPNIDPSISVLMILGSVYSARLQVVE